MAKYRTTVPSPRSYHLRYASIAINANEKRLSLAQHIYLEIAEVCCAAVVSRCGTRVSVIVVLHSQGTNYGWLECSAYE